MKLIKDRAIKFLVHKAGFDIAIHKQIMPDFHKKAGSVRYNDFQIEISFFAFKRDMKAGKTPKVRTES